MSAWRKSYSQGPINVRSSLPDGKAGLPGRKVGGAEIEVDGRQFAVNSIHSL